MSVTQQITLIAPPADCRQAMACGLPVAHMAYRIGTHGHLYRAEIPVSLRGGIMVLDNRGFDGKGDPIQLCREVVRECTARKFDGILCDFDGPPSPFLERTVAQLGTMTLQRGWSLYVMEHYAGIWERARVLIPTALSSGSLEGRLRKAVHQYGADRVALAVQRMAQEFRLPAGPDGGELLTRSELAQRVRDYSPAVFFDNGLCAHYFTYMNHGAARFVVFDDSGSLLRKLSLARELEIRRAFLVYPEVEEILPRLLGE